MKRNTLNYGIDALTGLMMVGMMATGLLVRFVLPPGSGSGRVLWGLARHDWGGMHFWLAAGLVAILLLHVALHWQWVCTTTLRFFVSNAGPMSRCRRNIAGGAVLTALTVGCIAFVVFATGQVEQIAGAEAGERHGARSALPDDQAESIKGSMTLAEVAAANGVSVERLKQALRLPDSIAPEERLGRLGKKYGFSMDQVRPLIEALE